MHYIIWVQPSLFFCWYFVIVDLWVILLCLVDDGIFSLDCGPLHCMVLTYYYDTRWIMFHIFSWIFIFWHEDDVKYWFLIVRKIYLSQLWVHIAHNSNPTICYKTLWLQHACYLLFNTLASSACHSSTRNQPPPKYNTTTSNQSLFRTPCGFLIHSPQQFT